MLSNVVANHCSNTTSNFVLIESRMVYYECGDEKIVPDSFEEYGWITIVWVDRN